MKKVEKINASFINKLSYPDFIGFINQWNTPPGSYATISKLAVFSKMTSDSYILEIACSTGFASREFANLTGCRGIGFDLSKNSISMANYNKKFYAPRVGISYKVADGYSFESRNKFTHIMVGGGLKFFPDSEKMLNRCIEMLKSGGCILATPYYQISPIPKNLAQKMHNSLGIPIAAFTSFSYKEVLAAFNKLEIVYEDRNELIQETEKEIEYYCKSIIDRACVIHNIDDLDVRQAMYNRLFGIRMLINESRPYQKYCVLVLRYEKSVYPQRYVALF